MTDPEIQNSRQHPFSSRQLPNRINRYLCNTCDGLHHSRNIGLQVCQRSIKLHPHEEWHRISWVSTRCVVTGHNPPVMASKPAAILTTNVPSIGEASIPSPAAL